MQRALLIGAIALAQLCAIGQTLSPREIFYDQSGMDKPAAKPKSSKPKMPSMGHSLPSMNTSKPQAQSQAEQVAVSTAETQASASHSDVANVSLVSNSTRPLGLKYTVLKRESPGQYVEVGPDTEFVAGDHIKISVQVNDSGYLYVITKGSSGVWKVMFPSAEVDNGDNRVKFGRTYDLPPGASFAFDNQSGSEKLFLVLSRQPVGDLEAVIYSLQDKPASSKNGDLPRPTLASNIAPIQDGVVDQLHANSRDLVIEKVDDSAAPPSDRVKKLEQQGGPLPPQGEKAVYVVNPSASPDGRVVADVELKHL